MKKALCLLAMGTLFVGCAAPVAKEIDSSMQNGSDVVVEIDGISITRNDLYKEVIKSSGSSQVLDTALAHIAEKEITDTDALNAKVEELKEQYAQYMDGDIAAYAEALGYDNVDTYVEEVLFPTAKQTLLKQKYVDENVETIIKEHTLRYIKTISIESEEEAKKLIKDIKSIEDFDSKSEELGTGTDVGIVTKNNTSVDANVIELLDSFTADGMYSKPILTTGGQYIIVYVYHSDTSAVMDDIKGYLYADTFISTEAQAYFLKKYNFEVFENRVKQEIKDISEDFIG